MPRPRMAAAQGRALLLALCVATVAQAQTTEQEEAGATRGAQQVFARVGASVVTVLAQGADGRSDGQGSGVVVAPGLVATNCHVVRSATSLRLAGATGEQPAQWTRQLAELDLCLLAAPGLTAPPVALRDSAALAVGEPVYAVGNPLGFGLAVSSGLLASRQAGQPYARLTATAPVSPGSSGGGLFDREARLLGLTTAILGTGQSLNLVLPAEAISALLAQGAPRPQAEPPPPAEPRWAMVAAGLYERQDAAGLQAHAQAWAQAQPHSAPALVYLARAAGQQQGHAQAETLARSALALDGDLASAWSALAQALIATGRIGEGEQALDEAARRQPDEADAHIVRFFLRQSQGQREAARAEMREAVRKRPFSPRLWTELGRQEEAFGQADAARQAFATAVRLGGTPSVAGTAAAAPPGMAAQLEALQALGWAELRKRRYVQAEEAFRKGLALDGEHAGLWNGIGAVMQGSVRWAEAEQAFTRALAREANDAVVLANRGEVLRVQRQFDRAMADAQTALRLKPDEPTAQRLLAALLLDMRRFAESAAAYTRLATQEQPQDDDLVNWAEALVNSGDAAGALARLRQAEAGQPARLRLYTVMGRVLGAQNDVAGALVYLERALAENPSASVVWSAKGYALMRLDRLPEAVTALETAVRLDPTLSNGWINLGHAQMRARNLGRAIEALEKAVVLAPEAMDGRFYLAQSYLQARMPAKAREHAQAVAARQPALPPVLALIAVSYLAENNVAEAGSWHRRLHAAAPEIAGKVRQQAIGAGIAAAQQWPE